MTVWLAQSRWEIRRMVRNRRFFFFTLLIPLFYYFLFVKIDGGGMKVGNTTWNAFFMISMAAFSAIGASINGLSGRIAFERTQGWLRLMQTTPLPARTYMGSKILAQVITAGLSSVVLFLAGTLFEHVRLGAGEWIICILWLAVGSLPFIMLGALIGLVAGAEASNMIASAVYLVISVIGGLWWPVQAMPSVMQHIAKLTPTYNFADITWRVIGHQTAPLQDWFILLAYFIIFSVIVLYLLRRNRDAGL
jgi:ABC-2 type transport system permease protein